MAISLPLTSIWATATVRHQAEAAAASPESQRLRLWNGNVGTGMDEKHARRSNSHSTLVQTTLVPTEQGVYPKRNYSLSSEMCP